MNSRLKTTLVALFFIVGIFNLYAQQVQYFEKILTGEGEANLSVRKVIQDHSGFLWLATFSGLYRYEGDDFIIPHTFGNNEEINSDVTSVLCDNNNNLWIGTNQGLSKYDLEKDKLITYHPDAKDSASIHSDKIRSLAMDSKGRIWIGTSDAGLIVYDPENEKFTDVVVKSTDNQSPVYIKTIFIDSNGVVWLGTLGTGLFSFIPSEVEATSVMHFHSNDTGSFISNNYVYCIYEDTDGTLVAGTRNGLNRFEKNLRTFLTVRSPGPEKGDMINYFRSIVRDASGKLWIGTFSGVILCDSFSDLETGNYQLLKHYQNVPYSISHDQILDIYKDNSGVIWIGTENGLNKFSPYQNQFQPLHGDEIDNLSEQTATDFCNYMDGVLILTLSDGLLLKNKKGITKIFEDYLTVYNNEKLYSLFVDAENNIWIGTFRGLLIKINLSTKTISAFNHSNNNVPIYSISESRNGVLLIGTGGEGMKYFNKRTEKFSTENSLSGVNINHILEDSKGNLWVATQQGIFKNSYETSSFEYYLPDNPDSLVNPNIFNEVAESAEGTIYVGGRNGLYEYNQSSNKFFRKNFDVPFRFWLTNLQYDSKQNLWLNLNFNRIGIISKETGILRVFNINNGIRSIAHNRRGFFIDKNDELYLSGFDRIFSINTSGIITNLYSPTPVLTRLIINNNEVRPGTELNRQVILENDIRFQEKIILNHQNKDFTIYFTSTSYMIPRDNKYRYILHGYDREWQTGNERKANYINLNPGYYEFEVYSANNDGIWSDSPARLSVRIRPAPFLSWWAFCIYFIILVVSVIEIRRIILARIRLKHELIVERVKRDKEEKFNQERLRFYTNVSHELRTPLTLIMAPIKLLIDGEKSDSVTSRLHNLILNNAQRLLSLTNQLLDFRKSLFEGMKLKATYSNISEIIKSNISAFEYMTREKNITLNYDEEEELTGWVDQEKFDMILFNLLSNAVKYTPDNGFINVHLKVKKDSTGLSASHAEISVANSGKGIPRQLHHKVFERFYQIGDEHPNAANGTGIGLSLVKNLVELHHGKIMLESDPGKLTTFTVLLPVEKEAYNDIEIFDFKRDADRRTKELMANLKRKKVRGETGRKKSVQQKILIVEDNIELSNFLSDFLSEEYFVSVAANGIEGIENSKTGNPDLVISDVMMDKMDGFQFCSMLKNDPEISHIPVILMTALASVENKMTGYKTGADDYITKPFEPELLKIRIKNILENIEKERKRFRNELNFSAIELTRSKIDEDFINKVTELLEGNLEKTDFDIDSVCRNLAVSSSQLYRKIKSITGLSPNEYIRNYRLKKAAILLKETNLNVSEIAYKVGFNDALYFSKCFKKMFGTSPTSYFSRT